MADDDHVAAAADGELARDLDSWDGSGIGHGPRPEPGTAGSGTDVHEGSTPTREFEHEREGSPSESSPVVDQHVTQPRACYPLNSRRLTACHLRALSKALELPTTGPADQLRQCIEAVVQRDHEYRDVVVTVRESPKIELTVALADSDGEFLVCEPVYRDSPLRRVRVDEEAWSSSELRETRQKLEEANRIIELAAAKEKEHTQIVVELQETLCECEEQATKTCDDLRERLAAEKEKARSIWRTNCGHLAEQDTIITAQQEELTLLRRRVTELEVQLTRCQGGAKTPLPRVAPDGPRTPPETLRRDPASVAPHLHPLPPAAGVPSPMATVSAGPSCCRESRCADNLPSDAAPASTPRRMDVSDALPVGLVPETLTHLEHSAGSASVQQRRGRAPPIEFFSGEDPAITVDDWLPSLERASTWNGWSVTEKLMQLPGYLNGQALQEWRLLSQTEQQDYTMAIQALRGRLDPGSKTMAAQDFRHSLQRSSESVPDFIRRLEKTYQIAYGKDDLNTATRCALLYSQLYEGLCYDLMQSPAVSGAQNYQELCTAAKGEERRVAALKQRRQFTKTTGATPSLPRASQPSDSQPQPRGKPSASKGQRVCFKCSNPGHFAMNCPQAKQESKNRESTGKTRQVQVNTQSRKQEMTTQGPEPSDFLYSSSEEDTPANVRTVHITDKGSIPQCVRVQVQGVPAYGLIDSGADITIIGGTLFKKVAAVAKLRKRDFKQADKVPRTYDQRPFQLDGRMDLDIEFMDLTMTTAVYIKMDAHDQLLLSEGVCRQLGILQYHPSVERWRGGRKGQATPTYTTSPQDAPQGDTPPTTMGSPQNPSQGAVVPTVRVNLLQSTQILPHQSKVVEVALADNGEADGSYFLQPALLDSGLQVDPSLLQIIPDQVVRAVVSNPTGLSMSLEEGDTLGEATLVDVVSPPQQESRTETTEGEPFVRLVQTKSVTWRKERLVEGIGALETLTPHQQQELLDFLSEHHKVFALEEHERGETDLVEMEIYTGDAHPRRCAPRRMPFSVREEVAKQIERMQAAKVIQPSTSPWASPVVMVRKKDGTHRFCIDYRQLNAVTRADTYPLPRIDDLLDQLGQCHYFSTLDLASGYWQIRMSPASREKTAFTTPQGLYEFLVMPFGLTNAPAVFQRLMQRLVTGLNPASGPDFVAVYIDDILVFSPTLEQHLSHLRAVIERISEAGLKLKPSKCLFVRSEVEYLGHLITPEGLKPNSRLVAAVRDFPRPTNVSGVRRFLGLSSYYRRFIRNFAKIAEPLRELTRKNATFTWTVACEDAMDKLKERLTTAPVLAYPAFRKPYTVETDASISGLGAVLSQTQPDQKLHPVAYASRSLSTAERNYCVTELETLAVVWALTRFHSYLYGQSVTVITDHTAVRAVLETPDPSCKHARWWTKVYGAGLKDVKIVYRAGQLNHGADALSRSPHALAPAQGGSQDHVQVASVRLTADHGSNPEGRGAAEICDLLGKPPELVQKEDFATEQRKDPDIAEVIKFLECGDLPVDQQRSRQIALQKPMFTMESGMLFYIDPKQDHCKRVVVPRHLRHRLLSEHHSSQMGGHFAVRKTYGALMRHWWWDGMYSDTKTFTRNCPQCAVVTGGERPHRPPLHPIPVSRPFQIVGVDVMELPRTDRGNQYVLVFQDFLTKWPLAFPMPDQKSQRIAELLVNEVIPLFGVPESLLSDRGTNLLSHLMRDICSLLGITKLNTTAYHPQCDGMVERFNRTLKTMLRKHAATFGSQWDRYLPGVLWAYRNVPHDSTNEKPSFLLLGIDCRTPSEAALLPPQELEPTEVSAYREEVVLSLSTARRLAAESIKVAQARYKRTYDKSSRVPDYQLGDWVLVRFPQEETGRLRKLSRPWHGPYRVVERRDPDLTMVKVYAPQDGQIQVHQTRVAHCPPELPAGFFWYGTKRSSPGRPPRWVDQLLRGDLFAPHETTTENGATPSQESDPNVLPETTELPTSSTGLETSDTPECPEASIGPPSGLDELAEPSMARGHAEGSSSNVSSQEAIGEQDQGSQDPDPGAVTDVQSHADHHTKETERDGLNGSQLSGQKYGLRKKRLPPARLMSVTSRSSFSRGGGDVEQMPTDI